MSKDKISDYSATANSNTDIAGINIDEGCAPSGINNAIRTLMKQLKDFQQGTNSDSFNGPTNGAHNGSVGATTPAAGTFTTLSATGNVTLGDASADTVTVNGTTNFVAAPTIGGVGLGMGFKNRIINGAMNINQRAFGSTPANFDYLTDRFQFRASQASKFTASQSNVAPAGFINSLLFTSSSAYSVGSTEQFGVRQFIEGLNIADLGWGTANAQPVTLSFWVRSSITGTHSGALGNSGDARAHPFSFTVNSANTWEQKTITIAGDTSGTWLTTNGIGIKVNFNLGAGSSMLAAAGSWTTGEIVGATGSVSVVGTNGATFYITGVQLEKGSTATSFDYRPYGTELALCQRYYQRFTGTTGQFTKYGVGVIVSTTACNGITIPMKVSMRSQPAISGSGFEIYDGAVTRDISSYNNLSSPEGISFDATCSGASFTAYRPGMVGCGLTTDYLEASAEL